MEWVSVSNLKEGDRVGITGGGFNESCAIVTVAKRTATQAVMSDGSRWSKNGRRIGNAGSFYSAHLITEQGAIERIAALKEKRARSERIRVIESIRWRELDIATLDEVIGIATSKAKST